MKLASLSLLAFLTMISAANADVYYSCRLPGSDAPSLRFHASRWDAWLGHKRFMNYFPFNPNAHSRHYTVDGHNRSIDNVVVPTAMITGEADRGEVDFSTEDFRTGFRKYYTYRCSK